MAKGKEQILLIELLSLYKESDMTAEEMVNLAREIKKTGAYVEVFSADFFGAKQIETDPTGTFTLFEEGLVDAIVTDYSGGYHDPILLLIKKAVEKGVVSLPHAVRLATSSPASIIPGLAPYKGFIEPGKVADIIIVDKDDITKVRYVIIAGRIVVEDGKIVV